MEISQITIIINIKVMFMNITEQNFTEDMTMKMMAFIFSYTQPCKSKLASSSKSVTLGTNIFIKTMHFLSPKSV